MKKILSILLSLFLLMMIILYVLSSMEITESYFETYEEAVSSINAGWLPRWLPTSSYDIRETHDVDSNAVLAVFKVGVLAQLDNLSCENISKEEFVIPKESYIERFPDFVSDMFLNISAKNGIEPYRCGEYYLGLNKKIDVVYLWRLADRI